MIYWLFVPFYSISATKHESSDAFLVGDICGTCLARRQWRSVSFIRKL